MRIQRNFQDLDDMFIEVHVITENYPALPDRWNLVDEGPWERQRHIDYRLDKESSMINRESTLQDSAQILAASEGLAEKCKNVLTPMCKSWGASWNHLDVVLIRGVSQHQEFTNAAGCWANYAHSFNTGDPNDVPWSPLILMIVQEGAEDRIWPTLVHELVHVAWAAQASNLNEGWYAWVLEEGAADYLLEVQTGSQNLLDRGPAWEGDRWLEGLNKMSQSMQLSEASQEVDTEKLNGHYKLGYQVVSRILQQEDCSIEDFISISNDLRRDYLKRLIALENQ